MNAMTKSISLGATAVALASASSGAEIPSMESLLSQLRNSDDNVRGPAWKNAGTYGAPAVEPLAKLMTDPDQETARAARRALGQIVHEAGRPGQSARAKAVSSSLVQLLSSSSTVVQAEALWLLSEIAGDTAVPAMATLLSNPQVREDARCALTRLPGQAASRALRSALASAPEDFKPALAQALRARGETVAGYPDQKLVPRRKL
jgi:HEAT repeat protein